MKRRWGVYQEPGGEYTRAQRLHNQGQLAAILALRRHGFPAFPTMGIVIEASYWASNRRRTIRFGGGSEVFRRYRSESVHPLGHCLGPIIDPAEKPGLGVR